MEGEDADMLAGTMKIRFLIPWRNYAPGQVFDEWPSGMAEEMIRRGIIEEVKDEPKKQNWKRK